VEDRVDRLVDEVRLGDVDVDEHERVRAQVGDVHQRPGVEVVDADHAVPAGQQFFTQVRAQESCAPCD
jgi:hypothetical protein